MVDHNNNNDDDDDDDNNDNNLFPLSLIGASTQITVLGNSNSGWTPEITLRANMVGYSLYWKLNLNCSGKYD